MTFDGKAFGKEIVAVVKGFVADELKPLVKRLDDLEQQLKSLPTPKDGKDADPETVAELVKCHVQSELADIRATIEAWSAPEPDREVMRGMVETAVSEAISAIPVPKDGKDGRDGIDGKTACRASAAKKANAGSALPVRSSSATAVLQSPCQMAR